MNQTAKPSLLIVDDTPVNIDVLTAIFSDEFRVKAALNGERALKIANGDDKPSLILLDIVMPNVDGYEICRQLKENPETSNIPVIFITARNQEADEEFGFSLGAVDYITKPFSPSIVQARVQTQLTLALQNQALIAAREEAERANQSKSDFLAKVTHEIRTPINALRGVHYLARRASSPEKLDKYLETAERAIEYVALIIDDILDFSKLEAGKITLDPHSFYLREIIDDCITMVEVRANESGVRLTTDVDVDIPAALYGDAQRIKQILLNLLSNAVKFSDTDDVVRLKASLASAAGDDLLIEFAVEDSGIGMTADEVKGLFQSYQQANNSISRTHGGTGLGLAISKQLTEMMGGVIGVTSEKGRGSVFTLSLPLRADNTGMNPLDEGATDCPNDGSAPLKILLVEDNKDNQEIIGELLELEDNQVFIVNHGREAVEFLSEYTVDVVLMDCQMPVMNGYDAAHNIRNELGVKTPIFAMTGNTSTEDHARALDAGMTDLIPKPIDPDVLFAMLSSIKPAP